MDKELWTWVFAWVLIAVGGGGSAWLLARFILRLLYRFYEDVETSVDRVALQDLGRLHLIPSEAIKRPTRWKRRWR